MNYLRQLFTIAGYYLPEGLVGLVISTANYLAVGRWFKRHSFKLPTRVSGRHAVWRYVASHVADQRVLYLEFGVFRGESIRWWAQALRNPNSHLHGFDSFEGLPECGGPWEKGQFGVHGVIPEVPDPRVRFFKGWFSQTLRDYVPPAHETLVINIDVDLYSSSTEVLSAAGPWLRTGTFLIFDDFHHLDHEARAFSNFLAATGSRFESVCADRTLNFNVFRCIQSPVCTKDA
jgi:hypothetical protein